MFANRVDAGEQLAHVLVGQPLPQNMIVLGIPRGGIVVAAVVAKRLKLPLGSIVVKKIGAPYNPELAIGAVGEENIVYWDQEVISRIQITPDAKRILQEKVEKSVREREEILASVYHRPEIRGNTVLLVDDGIATGATAVCAAAVAKHYKAAEVLLATPVIPASIIPMVRPHVSEIITLVVTEAFSSVGQFYASFAEVSDEEVQYLLASSEESHSKGLQT